ncbi:putative receptor protein kinase ZmPK1 [Spatholobus suberectus]|nr:putative receptor protein kinase ZmPK1 [Spatholobus suberectus]
MAFSILFLLLPVLSFHCSHSASLLSLSKGSSLSVEKPQDAIVSPNCMFSAGFVGIGENGYSLAIWFTQTHSHSHPTTVWMANRENPVNGKRSKLSLLQTGNLVLVDAGQQNVRSSNTVSFALAELHLKDDGNLVLRELQGTVLRQSFDFLTDTLLPGQPLTRHAQLVSARSESNHSSGFYKLFFDDDNVLRLLYDGPDVSSVYWPNPWQVSWDAGRSTYKSDDFTFTTSDYGVMKKRRLKIDSDGNLRMYSLHDDVSNECYDPKIGRECSRLPGHRVKNHSDWSYGCEPLFVLTCNRSESTFLEMPGLELYGYDSNFSEPSTYRYCENLCLEDCNCNGFQHSYNNDNNDFMCYLKKQLLNGRRTPNFKGTTYLRVPKNHSLFREESFDASEHVCSVQIPRAYVGDHVSRIVRLARLHHKSPPHRPPPSWRQGAKPEHHRDAGLNRARLRLPRAFTVAQNFRHHAVTKSDRHTAPRRPDRDPSASPRATSHRCDVISRQQPRRRRIITTRPAQTLPRELAPPSRNPGIIPVL